MMHIESLANELLLEVFQYLTTSHIYYAFHDLNSHFDGLILEYFRTCDIDFRSISRSDFQIICEHYLTHTTDRITSLCLSDDDDTPGQIEQFFAHGFTLRQFTSLESLYLSNIRSRELLRALMTDISSLSNLVDLTFEQCAVPAKVDEEMAFANAIWSLPSLIHCCLKAKYKYRQSHHFVNKYRRDQGVCLRPTVVSLTLERLSFIGLQPCDLVFNQLFIHTPRLRYLVVDRCLSTENHPSTPILLLTTLVISLSHSYNFYLLLSLLRNTPNLLRLKVDLHDMLGRMSGQHWEQAIINHLPRLKQLQLRTRGHFRSGQTEQSQVYDALDPFQSRFWLIERQWFVQCDWCPNHGITLFTLPLAFDDYQVLLPIMSVSTCSDRAGQRAYDHVRNLAYRPRVDEMSSPANIQFANLQHLSITLPVSEHFQSMVPTLAHLISLDVLSTDHTEECQQQLHDLLNRAPRLSSIRLCWNQPTSSLHQLLNSRNLSMYHIELLYYGESMKNEQYAMLSSIMPGVHCKVLTLTVADRWCIPDLVKTLRHLSAMNIRCRQKKFISSLTSSRDRTCEWLQSELLSTFPNIYVSRDKDAIRLWLR